MEKYDIDFTYWCCDGFKGVRSDDETYGLFTNDFMTVRNYDIYQDLMRIVPKKWVFINEWKKFDIVDWLLKKNDLS